MSSENLIKNLRILGRTERIIADIRLRHLLIGIGMPALAALLAAFGLLMLELAGYLLWCEWPPAQASFASSDPAIFSVKATARPRVPRMFPPRDHVDRPRS